MPDATSTAEIVRDTEGTRAPVKADAPKPFTASGLLDRWEKSLAAMDDSRTVLREQRKAREAELTAAQDKAATAAASAAQVGAGVKTGAEAVTKAATAPQPAMPATAREPAAPSQKIQPFLEPKAAKDSLGALVNGLGLLAQVFAGRGAPVAALRSLEGAMTGWKQGDKERADREWREYLGQVDTIRHENGEALKLWEVAMRQHGGNLNAAQAVLTASLAEAGQADRAALVAQQGVMAAGLALDKVDNHLNQIDEHTAKLIGSMVTAQALNQHRADMLQWRREDAAAKKQQGDDAVAAFTPEVLKPLGQQWFMEGKLPALGNMRGGGAIRAKVVAAGIAWAQENDIDPMSSPTVRAEVGSAKKGLDKTRGQKAISLANVGNFEKHLDTLVELGKKVDRTEVPALNAAILKGQRDWAGSKEAGVYLAQAFEVSMEYAKVMVGSAQGDAATRDEARKAIATNLTQGQLEALRDTLKLNAKNRIKAWEESENDMLSIISSAGQKKTTTAGGGAGLPAGLPDPKTHKRVRDNTTGTEYVSDGTHWTEAPGGR